MSTTQESGKQWLHTVAGKHLPRNARRYSFRVYSNERAINGLGFQTDLSPVEGKLVEIGESFVAIKAARAEFFVCAKDLMESVPDIGAVVRVTPYARRKFDGSRLDSPVVEEHGTYRTSIVKIGERVSPIPIDKTALKSEYLKDMICQVEELPAPDGIRTLAQLLIDAGAATESVTFEDPVDGDVISKPPMLEFRIASQKWSGYLQLIYDRASDLYRVQLTEPERANVEVDIEDVDFTSLGEVIANLVDDGLWRVAKVEILKPAPRSAAKAA